MRCQSWPSTENHNSESPSRYVALRSLRWPGNRWAPRPPSRSGCPELTEPTRPVDAVSRNPRSRVLNVVKLGCTASPRTEHARMLRCAPGVRETCHRSVSLTLAARRGAVTPSTGPRNQRARRTNALVSSTDHHEGGLVAISKRRVVLVSGRHPSLPMLTPASERSP